MSPKSNKSGVSYDERDPRSVPARHEDDEQGPVVVRARDMDAAIEGLRADRPDADPDDFVGDEQERLGGLEEVQGGSPATDSYDDKDAWPYADLQAESRKRWPDLVVNGVTRDDLVARLRADDAEASPSDD